MEKNSLPQDDKHIKEASAKDEYIIKKASDEVERRLMKRLQRQRKEISAKRAK